MNADKTEILFELVNLKIKILSKVSFTVDDIFELELIRAHCALLDLPHNERYLNEKIQYIRTLI